MVASHAFLNNEQFSFATDLTISGPGNAEAGVLIAPWWSKNVDGFINFRTTDGEIAMFGGRLPFYSFTGQHGVTYTKGETVRVATLYDPNSLSMADPATLQVWLTIGTPRTPLVGCRSMKATRPRALEPGACSTMLASADASKCSPEVAAPATT